MKKEEIEKISYCVNKAVGDCYWSVYWALAQVLKPYKKIPVELMFRYIDDDCEQDIIRVKKVYLNEHDEVCYISDEWNGQDWAADVRFDYNDCFKDEGEGNLFEATPESLFNLDFINELYNEVVNYAIPKLENNGQDS